MSFKPFLLALFTIFFIGCSNIPLDSVEYKKIDRKISFYSEIKPILDKRCVSCHSCYNSPCQLKLDSYDGLLRGGTKELVYDTRLRAAEPTRLFIDAQTPQEWRGKGFHSISDTLDTNSSILMHYLYVKKQNPKSIGDYDPENDKLTCAKNQTELEEYFSKNQHKAMPYGFPELDENEYNLIMNYMQNGMVDDSPKDKITKYESLMIKKTEEFLNKDDIKSRVSARYIYEHIYLAHIYFDEKSGNFFELIRSSTPSGEKPKIIPTRFVYDEIQEPFYYRLQKVESTIVHKTHMVYNIDDKKLQFFDDIFIKKPWNDTPYLPSYDSNFSPNALEVFEQIPAQSRYEFMLKDIYFFINTFIKGPVCKGQVALNVIQDQFWVAFVDPKYDLSVIDKDFLKNNYNNLKIPNQLGENPSLYKTFKNLSKEKQITEYQTYKTDSYAKYFPDGFSIDMIWRGNKDKNDALLSIYRHFDSASLHYGALGNTPKNMWVIDFALLERIYYSLVAGFDVYGNTAHQLLIRTHMDRLRVEGEAMFLEFLPQNTRADYFNSWYEGWLAQYLTVYKPSNNESSISYTTSSPKEELISKILDYTSIKKDEINFVDTNATPKPLKKAYKTKKDIEQTLQSLSMPNQVEAIKYYTDKDINSAIIIFKMNNKKDYIYSMIINRWHKNVALMFKEENRLDPTKDDIDFIEGIASTYPNIFIVVNEDDIGQFFEILKHFDKTDINAINRFVILRSHLQFWKYYDYLEDSFKKQNPLEYGLMDLNRYYKRASKAD